MSIVHVAWAYAQETGSPTRKAVLVALADYAHHDTGKCCPHISTLAAKTELSEPTVKRALVDLEAARFFTRSRPSRPDGTKAGYDYLFPNVRVTADPGITLIPGPGITETPDPGITLIPQEPVTPLEPVNQEHPPIGPPTTAVAIVTRRGWAVDRKTVSDEEDELARQILAAWNTATGQKLGAQTWLAKIVMRIREHPDATVADHQAIIAAALADPWWSGPPTPSVVYGNDAQFERSIEQVRAALNGGQQGRPPPRRYGRGMTTREILDTYNPDRIPQGGSPE